MQIHALFFQQSAHLVDGFLELPLLRLHLADNTFLQLLAVLVPDFRRRDNPLAHRVQRTTEHLRVPIDVVVQLVFNAVHASHQFSGNGFQRLLATLHDYQQVNQQENDENNYHPGIIIYRGQPFHYLLHLSENLCCQVTKISVLLNPSII